MTGFAVGKFLHVGVVVMDIGHAADLYRRFLGLDVVSETVVDEIQKVKVAFVEVGNQVSLELIAPLSPDSPVSRLAERGGGLAHLCYEVEDVDAALTSVRNQGAIVVCEPVAAAAFDGRRIAFVSLPDLGVIEFVEAARTR